MQTAMMHPGRGTQSAVPERRHWGRRAGRDGLRGALHRRAVRPAAASPAGQRGEAGRARTRVSQLSRVALFTDEPMTCLERIEAMLMQYVVAAWVAGVFVGSRLF